MYQTRRQPRIHRHREISASPKVEVLDGAAPKTLEQRGRRDARRTAGGSHGCRHRRAGHPGDLPPRLRWKWREPQGRSHGGGRRAGARAERDGPGLVSRTMAFVQVSMAKGSADPDETSKLRDDYEQLARESVEMEIALTDSSTIFLAPPCSGSSIRS